jgi:hypothetical protein
MSSSVGRVTTRDSSKEAAGTHDLFVSVCGDDAIYPIFKNLKGRNRLVFATRGLTRFLQFTIESSLKFSSKLQRSKSFSRPDRLDTRDGQFPDPLSQSRSRPSSDSAPSDALPDSAGSVSHALRTPLEKGNAIKLFPPPAIVMQLSRLVQCLGYLQVERALAPRVMISMTTSS